jgi:hypothetical protein
LLLALQDQIRKGAIWLKTLKLNTQNMEETKREEKAHSKFIGLVIRPKSQNLSGYLITVSDILRKSVHFRVGRNRKKLSMK